MEDQPALLKPSDTARMLAISRATLAVLERTGRLVPVDLGRPDGAKRLLRYRLRDVAQFAGLADD